jgi:hypothetical protein
MNPSAILFALNVINLVLGMFICFCILSTLLTSLFVALAVRGRLDEMTLKSQTSTLLDTSRSTSRKISLTRERTVCHVSGPLEPPDTATR